MSLQFKDIQDWKPSSISIVDKPAHPLAVFEVYEDDDEFIRKYKPMVNIMSEKEQENNVTISESFFEKLFGGLVSKSESTTPPEKPPVKKGNDNGSNEKDEDTLNVEEEIAKVNARLDEFDKRLSILENPEKEQKNSNDSEDVAPGAVKKSEESDVIDDNNVVKKSKSLDPDLSSVNHKPTKSFMERIGRSEDGMKW